ncbi:hypothetical protein BDB01DRAFT_905963 [Pilobolus umbonatus]|nr:hypothetical protein BDB01DRAFT_905963 [Pilobolus umbonatus]
MLLKSSLLKQRIGYNKVYCNITRILSTRAGIQDDGMKKVIEDIKHLEYKLEKKSKKRSDSWEQVNEEDIRAIYKEISTPIPIKPKITPDYLEKLKIKFLDTRVTPQLESEPLSVTSETQSTPDQPVTPTAESTIQNLSLKDFEQLIYVNALASRPREAEQALKLMEKYNVECSVKAMNHLIDAYANAHKLEDAVLAFKRLKGMGLTPDMHSYGSLIKAFVRNERLEDAIIIFENMKKNMTIPSQPIFSNLISGCLKANKVEKAWEIFDSMRLAYHQPDEVSFTSMLHACAKRGEVERALNLFEDMAKNNLYPTDVTFNVLINACARRPDYYHEAFSLLHQMQEHYGFQPDKITFNTLLTACARKKDLREARLILKYMLEDVEQNGVQSLISPDAQTYTNLFWCYASYLPANTDSKQKEKTKQPADITSLSTHHSLLPDHVPNKRSKIILEAELIYNNINNSNVQVTPALLTSYLAVHASQRKSNKCIDIYNNEFSKHNIDKDAFTFYQALQYCYKTKNDKFAWKVWEDYQDFLEKRNIFFYDGESVSEKKAKEAEKNVLSIKEGWTDTQQQQMAILMANTLARTNDVKNSSSILSCEARRSSEIAPFRLRDVMTVYNKCIQLEDEATKRELVHLCIKDKKRIVNSKFHRVNT